MIVNNSSSRFCFVFVTTFFKFTNQISDYLQNQLLGLSIRSNITMTMWSSIIYGKIVFNPISNSILDCILECFVLDGQNCTLFVFENNICYKGGMDYASGTVQEMYSSTSLFYKHGKYLILWKIR